MSDFGRYLAVKFFIVCLLLLTVKCESHCFVVVIIVSTSTAVSHVSQSLSHTGEEIAAVQTRQF